MRKPGTAGGECARCGKGFPLPAAFGIFCSQACYLEAVAAQRAPREPEKPIREMTAEELIEKIEGLLKKNRREPNVVKASLADWVLETIELWHTKVVSEV